MSRAIIICKNCENVEYLLFDDCKYDACPNCGSDRESETIYTEEELQEAVKQEREEIIAMLKQSNDYKYTGNDLAYLIRARGKE